MQRVSTDLLKLKKQLLKACVPSAAALEAWPLVCGEHIAKQTRALDVSGKVLRVLVPTVEWQRELTALSADYVRRLNEVLPGTFTRVEFVTTEAAGKKLGS